MLEQLNREGRFRYKQLERTYTQLNTTALQFTRDKTALH
jgi:hypothetical protein